jgi:hypothetical protein
MSGSRILSAIGAVLIFIGGAAGFADLFGPNGVKIALALTIGGGAINLFTERIQGGASDPAVRAQAAAADANK